MRTLLYKDPKPKTTVEKRTYSLQEAAQILGVSDETLRVAIHKGTLPFNHTKIERRYVISKADVDAAVDGRLAS